MSKQPVELAVEYNLNDTILKDMMNKLKEEIVVRVGILGGDGSKMTQDGKITMAYLGSIHEFGASVKDVKTPFEIPERSFLRMPLDTKLGEELEKSSKFKQAFQDCDMQALGDEIGLASLNVINDAFDSGGLGKWQPLAESTIARKGSDTILIDTGDLRRSISYEVVEK